MLGIAGGSKDQLIIGIFLWTSIYENNTVCWPAKTHINQLYEDTECRTEDLSRAMLTLYIYIYIYKKILYFRKDKNKIHNK